MIKIMLYTHIASCFPFGVDYMKHTHISSIIWKIMCQLHILQKGKSEKNYNCVGTQSAEDLGECFV